MAASGLERDDEGLKLDPNFELLAILLALALQEEDAERFLEVYDHVVPKSMSGFEVEGIKDRARELSDLPRETLLELKAVQESEAALFPPSLGGSLGRFVSRRIADSQHHRDAEAAQTDDHPGKFLSKSGALLSQRLNAQPPSALGDKGDECRREETLSHLDDIRDRPRVDTGSQAGVSYIEPEKSLPDSVELLDRRVFAHLSDDDLSATGDRNSSLTENQWSTMEAATAHNKVQKVQTSSVKQHKKLSHHKGSTPLGHDQQALMNGTADNVNNRTSTSTDKDKHCIKSKPPLTNSAPGPVKSKAGVRKPNCLLSHVENSYFDDICELDDCTKEEQEALIPKSPPVPASPPFKSLEEVGHSIGELLTSRPPKKFTCPPPLFLSKTTATLQYSADCGMAAKAETKYGTIPYSDTNSAAVKDGIHRLQETMPAQSDALSNHQLPDTVAEDSTHVQTNSFSTPEVPSPVNKSAVNVCSSGGEASDSLDKDEFDGGADEQPSNIAVQWNAAKKKKKKNKKKKMAGTGAETINANKIKLPVGASPLLQSPPELRHKHQSRDSQNAGQHTRAAATKLTSESPSESARHPPPMISSDSVTSSGESSTDGGTCVNDMSSHGATKKDASLTSEDNPISHTMQTSSTKNNAIAVGKSVLNSMKDNRTQENLSTNLPAVSTTSPADVHLTADIQPRHQSMPKTPSPQLNQSHAVKGDPSDSDSDRVEVKLYADRETISERPAVAGKPHSLSEPTASADSSADNDDNFIKVEYKRAKKRSYMYGYADDQKFAPSPGRYMYMDRDRDRDYFRNKYVLSAGLRKSSSEPTGMSELGDQDSEELDSNKAKPKNLSDSVTKTDTNVMSSVQSEPTIVPRSEFSYASKVKSNMKTSSLPPKLNPQALLDYVDDDQSDNPANSDNSPESVTKSVVLESKALPSGKSVLDKNNPCLVEKSDFIATYSAKEQAMKNNIRPEKHYDISQVMKPPDSSAKLGQSRSFQRSSSVDTNEVTKKVSFDDNSIRRTVPPQGPEASVQYLDLTYAGCLKGQRPAISKSTTVSQQPLSQYTQQPPIAGLKDLRSQPSGLKPKEKESLVTSKASIVLTTNPSPSTNEASRGSTPAARPIQNTPISSADTKPVDQPANLAPRATTAPLPPTLSRNSTSSPTPSVGSSSSRPHPTFDLEPQDNFDITFGSVIVGKVGFEILGEDSSAAERGSPIAELLAKVPMSTQVLTPPGLSCAELERSIMSRDSSLPLNVQVDDAEGGSSAAMGVSFGKFDSAWGITAALQGTEDSVSDFNHLEVAAMLMAEWRKTQEEILQNKVLVIGISVILTSREYPAEYNTIQQLFTVLDPTLAMWVGC